MTNGGINEVSHNIANGHTATNEHDTTNGHFNDDINDALRAMEVRYRHKHFPNSIRFV